MKAIDERRLETDLEYRFHYLAEFMGFGAEDVGVIHGSAGALAPLVPALVDAVYAKLRNYDATWRHFVPQQHGFEGAAPQGIADVDENHPQIKFRKQHLARYLESLVTRPYDAKMVQYLDMVGKIHTDAAGSKAINVPLVQVNALFGFVADAITATIFSLNLPREIEVSAVRAFQKLLWIQSDLFDRHYVAARKEPVAA